MSLEKVAEAINKITGQPTNEIATESILTDMGIDSLKAINILFELEEEFNIEIPNELIPEMITVGDIVTCVASLREQQH